MPLVLEGVTKSFGGLRAVGGVSFVVPDGVVFGLIGPNGAGKTTVFNLVTGVYRPDSGAIRLGDRSLAALRPAQIAAEGVGRTFQNIRLFSQLTVIENLLVACELQKKAHLASAVLRLGSHYDDEQAMHDRALELLRIFELEEMAEDAPTSLSYGDQRRLEIARAMMLAPKVLLLDEPAAGMNYGEAEGLKTQIQWLRDEFDLTVVLVEHNMQVVMGVCEEIHVLDHGETIAHGTPEEIRKDAKVLAAYLGEEEEAPSVRAAVEQASQQELGQTPSGREVAPRSSEKVPAAAPTSEPKVPAPVSEPKVIAAPVSEPKITTPPSAPELPSSAPKITPAKDLLELRPFVTAQMPKFTDQALADLSQTLAASLEKNLSSSSLRAAEVQAPVGDAKKEVVERPVLALETSVEPEAPRKSLSTLLELPKPPKDVIESKRSTTPGPPPSPAVEPMPAAAPAKPPPPPPARSTPKMAAAAVPRPPALPAKAISKPALPKVEVPTAEAFPPEEAKTAKVDGSKLLADSAAIKDPDTHAPGASPPAAKVEPRARPVIRKVDAKKDGDAS